MCVLSIKVPIRKKSGNLFNEPCKQEILAAKKSPSSSNWTPHHLRKLFELDLQTEKFHLTLTEKTTSPESWKIAALGRNLHNCISSPTSINFIIISYTEWNWASFSNIYVYILRIGWPIMQLPNNSHTPPSNTNNRLTSLWSKTQCEVDGRGSYKVHPDQLNIHQHCRHICECLEG